MNTRAKFKCIEIQKFMGGTYDKNGKYVAGVLHNYRFTPVVGDTEENKNFFASTPSGVIELKSVRDDLFELDKEYYVDFTPFVYVPPEPVAVEEAQ